MPADRFLHPRAGHSEKVTNLSDFDFRVWVQYILSADDFGVMRATPMKLQADNDRLAKARPAQIEAALATIVGVDLIHVFKHQNRAYVFQHDWQTWQKIKFPRTTHEPKPPDESLRLCDLSTQELFSLYPGGQRRVRATARSDVHEILPVHFGNVHSSLTSPDAQSARLEANANGYRLTANGALPLDVAFAEFQHRYPETRRAGGRLTQEAYFDAVAKAGDPQALIDALENHLASEQWQSPKHIPSMHTWLAGERWRQRLPAKTAAEPKRPWGNWKPPEAK